MWHAPPQTFLGLSCAGVPSCVRPLVVGSSSAAAPWVAASAGWVSTRAAGCSARGLAYAKTHYVSNRQAVCVRTWELCSVQGGLTFASVAFRFFPRTFFFVASAAPASANPLRKRVASSVTAEMHYASTTHRPSAAPSLPAVPAHHRRCRASFSSISSSSRQPPCCELTLLPLLSLKKATNRWPCFDRYQQSDICINDKH